jgi:hypothetical protein
MGLIMEDDKARELLDLARDNNRMLRAMRRSAFIGGIIKFIFWILILIVIPYFTWLYIQPYLDAAIGQYNGIQGKTSALQGSSSFDLSKFQDLITQYFGGAK